MSSLQDFSQRLPIEKRNETPYKSGLPKIYSCVLSHASISKYEHHVYYKLFPKKSNGNPVGILNAKFAKIKSGIIAFCNNKISALK